MCLGVRGGEDGMMIMMVELDATIRKETIGLCMLLSRDLMHASE